MDHQPKQEKSEEIIDHLRKEFERIEKLYAPITPETKEVNENV